MILLSMNSLQSLSQIDLRVSPGFADRFAGVPRVRHGEYRVIYQMGMGLMAQLIAALEAKV